MIDFELHSPNSLEEAFNLLETYGDDARVMAGGTALVIQMKQRLAQPEHGEGCSVGVCGACTVLLDGQMVASCLALAAAVDGAEITTIEGLADEGRLHPVQQSFIDYGGFQCGICTPGQIMAAKALLDVNPSPTEQEIRDWMMGNLCRCTGWRRPSSARPSMVRR